MKKFSWLILIMVLLTACNGGDSTPAPVDTGPRPTPTVEVIPPPNPTPLPDAYPAAPAPTPLPDNYPPPTPAPRILGVSVGKLTSKEFTINLDFFDICIGTDAWNLKRCDAEMERLMALCAHYGVDRVLFRVSVCGAVCYHTKVMTPAFEDVFARYKIEGLD